MVLFSIKQKLLIHIFLYCHITTLMCTSPQINFSSQISQITMLAFYSNDYLMVVNTDQKIINYQISSNLTKTMPFGKCVNAYYYKDMYVYGRGDNNNLYNALFENLVLKNYSSYSQLSYSDSPLQQLVVLSGIDQVVSIKKNNMIQWMYSNNLVINLIGCTGQFNGLISFQNSQQFLALCGQILKQWDQNTANSQITSSDVIISPPIIGNQYFQILQLDGPLGDSKIQDFILIEGNMVSICNYSNSQVVRKQTTQLTSTPYQVLVSQWRFFYIDSQKTNIYLYEILTNNNLIQRKMVNGSFTISTMTASPDNKLLVYADQTSISVWKYTEGICQTGFMWDTDKKSCVQCLYYCYSCSKSISSCDICQNSSNGLNTYRQEIQSNCQCQSGYYDNGTLVCIQCPYNCQSCTINNQGNVVCSSCSQNSFRDQNISCSCTMGYYDNGTSICQKCDQTCLTCQIITSQLQCTKCDPNSFRIISSGKCVCQNGYQEYQPQQSKCISSACFSTCKTCSQPQNQYSCSTCSNDRTLVSQANGTICQCNSNFYESDKLVCEPCHFTCKTCNGGQSNSCLTCDSSFNRVFDSKTSTCICKDGYYDQSGICVQCDQTCQTCSGNGPQGCLSCFQKQNRNLSQKQCICNQGFISVNNNLICQQCADNCQICDSSQPFKCQVCLPNTNRILNAQTGNCYCQGGYFQNQSSSVCSQCDQSCKTCFNSSKNCLSCNDPLKILQGSTCVCQESYFQIEPTGFCQKCSSNCLKCSDSNSCTKCLPNFELSNKNQCVSIIPSTIPKETLHLVSNSTKTTVYASVGSTVAGSILLSSFQPNSSIATQLLLLQKFNFMLLINISYPQLLHEFFILFGGTSPISSLYKFNIIDKYLVKNEDSPVYISNQFSQEDISDSILKNSGGCVVIIIIFWLICLPFIILYKKNTTIRNAEEIKSNCTKQIKNIGENYYPYTLVLIHQILSLIIFFSVFLQIAAFVKVNPVSDSLFVPKIILLIIEGAYIFYIFGKSVFIINSIENYQQDIRLHSTEKIEQSIYSNINLNQKGNTFLSRNYKLIQIMIENIFIPVIIVFIGFDSKIQISFCLGFYVLLFLLTAATNPMYKFIDNLFLILDQSCWILLYATILFIAVKLSFIQDLNKINDSDLQLFTTLSWVAVGSCIVILLLNPIYLIAQLFILRKEYQKKIKEICNKIKQKFQKNENQDQSNNTNYDNVSLYDFNLRNTSKLWDKSTICQQHMLEQYKSMRQLQSNSSSIFNSPLLLSQVKKIKLNKQFDFLKKHGIEQPSKSLSLQQPIQNQTQEKNLKQNSLKNS
ncbi:hypothetical protein ABPG72_014762 [Tetrahymena utriculariae]